MIAGMNISEFWSKCTSELKFSFWQIIHFEVIKQYWAEFEYVCKIETVVTWYLLDKQGAPSCDFIKVKSDWISGLCRSLSCLGKPNHHSLYEMLVEPIYMHLYPMDSIIGMGCKH